ncbi:MAG TPA: ferritin-like domain-containing protein [Vicinamibacterales bacterium]|jgi:hypothetical protein
MTVSIVLEFAVVLAAIWRGARTRGLGLGLWGAVGLLGARGGVQGAADLAADRRDVDRKVMQAFEWWLEQGAASGYLGMVPVLGDRDLAKSVGSILGDEAMHWAILRQALGENPVPEPFILKSLSCDPLRPTALGRSLERYGTFGFRAMRRTA